MVVAMKEEETLGGSVVVDVVTAAKIGNGLHL
jgi:hypothetical protein